MHYGPSGFAPLKIFSRSCWGIKGRDWMYFCACNYRSIINALHVTTSLIWGQTIIDLSPQTHRCSITIDDHNISAGLLNWGQFACIFLFTLLVNPKSSTRLSLDLVYPSSRVRSRSSLRDRVSAFQPSPWFSSAGQYLTTWRVKVHQDL